MPTASSKLAEFFNVLRDTGTDLPASNAAIANLLRVAIDNLDIDSEPDFRGLKEWKLDALKVVQENLSADLDVMVEALEFAEDDDSEEEEGEDD